MKTLRDAAGLLIVLLLVFSVRIAPPSGEASDWIPTTHAASPPAVERSHVHASVGNEPTSIAPGILGESLRCAPADLPTEVRPEAPPEVRKPRACEIG